MDGGQDLGRKEAHIQSTSPVRAGFCRAFRMRLLVVNG